MTNYDPDNWDAHWTSSNRSATLNPAQSFRHKSIAKLVAKSNPQSLVDIGCGQGDFLQFINQVMPNVSLRGLELSKIGTEISQSKVKSAQIVQANLLEHNFNSSVIPQSEVATCTEVLEHLDEPKFFLTKAQLLIQPGGTLLVTVPSGPRTAFDKHIGHRQHFSSKSLKRLLAESGFVDISVQRYGWPFFNLYRLMVLLRGKRLIQDVENQTIENSKLSQLIALAFGLLFKVNIRNPYFGWQLIATCKTK